MTPKQFATWAGLTLLVTAAGASGQPAVTETESAGAPAAAEPAAGNTSQDNAGASPGADARPPSTYRPSEEISEDLSVSFPVDI